MATFTIFTIGFVSSYLGGELLKKINELLLYERSDTLTDSSPSTSRFKMAFLGAEN
jgi:hypothetical protein